VSRATSSVAIASEGRLKVDSARLGFHGRGSLLEADMARESATLIAIVGILSAVGALAADGPGPGQEERRICRGGTKQLSSRIRTTRRCLTAAQWAEEDQANSRLPLTAQITAGQNDGRQSAAPR
jgi:hypothetical protein